MGIGKAARNMAATSFDERLAQERRARLQAERLLALRSEELYSANRKLAEHAHELSYQVIEQREENAILKGETSQTRAQLEVATEKAVTAQRRLWDALTATEDGFAIFDRDWRMVAANTAFFDVFDGIADVAEGASYEAILRLAVEEGIVDIGTTQPEDWIDRMIARWEMDPIPRVDIKLWNGAYVRLNDKQTPQGDFVSLAVDITPNIRRERQLRAARDAALAASRAKSAFLANMSHEIRTPMNGVVSMAELILEGDLGEDEQLYAETIKNSGEALLVIINDVLDFSKIEAGKLELREDCFDLNAMVREIFRLVQPGLEGKAVELRLDYDIFLPAKLIGDRGRIRQVLTNLIGNAVKFTEKGHVTVHVFAGPGDQTPDCTPVRIVVEDTGVGIPEEKQAHVFGEFNQVEDSASRRYDGTGLGLAISKKLVRLMGGDMWLDSEPGVGSAFGFALPLKPDPDAELEPVAGLPADEARILVIGSNAGELRDHFLSALGRLHAEPLLLRRLPQPRDLDATRAVILCQNDAVGADHLRDVLDGAGFAGSRLYLLNEDAAPDGFLGCPPTASLANLREALLQGEAPKRRRSFDTAPVQAEILVPGPVAPPPDRAAGALDMPGTAPTAVEDAVTAPDPAPVAPPPGPPPADTLSGDNPVSPTRQDQTALNDPLGVPDASDAALSSVGATQSSADVGFAAEASAQGAMPAMPDAPTDAAPVAQSNPETSAPSPEAAVAPPPPTSGDLSSPIAPPPAAPVAATPLVAAEPSDVGAPDAPAQDPTPTPAVEPAQSTLPGGPDPAGPETAVAAPPPVAMPPEPAMPEAAPVAPAPAAATPQVPDPMPPIATGTEGRDAAPPANTEERPDGLPSASATGAGDPGAMPSDAAVVASAASAGAEGANPLPVPEAALEPAVDAAPEFEAPASSPDASQNLPETIAPHPAVQPPVAEQQPTVSQTPAPIPEVPLGPVQAAAPQPNAPAPAPGAADVLVSGLEAPLGPVQADAPQPDAPAPVPATAEVPVSGLEAARGTVQIDAPQPDAQAPAAEAPNSGLDVANGPLEADTSQPETAALAPEVPVSGLDANGPAEADTPQPETAAPAPEAAEAPSPGLEAPLGPVATDAPQPASGPLGGDGSTPTATPQPETGVGQRPRILAAEDNKTNQLVFRKMLKTLDLDIELVENGRALVEAYKAHVPDMVLTDISMPEMDGLEAAAMIRAYEAEQGLPPVRMVAMTAHALEGDRQRILAAGIDDYITKPLKKAVLHGQINDTLSPKALAS